MKLVGKLYACISQKVRKNLQGINWKGGKWYNVRYY